MSFLQNFDKLLADELKLDNLNQNQMLEAFTSQRLKNKTNNSRGRENGIYPLKIITNMVWTLVFEFHRLYQFSF